MRISRASSRTSIHRTTPPLSLKGFTIVELLVVIVVIAILAAITIVSYNGVQQRASNTAIIDAASKTIRAIQGYIAVNGTYPLVTGVSTGGCVTTSSGCYTAGAYGNNATLTANLATIATTPTSVPYQGTNRYGVLYYYEPIRTMNGDSAPVTIIYFLNGVNLPCGIAGVQTIVGNTRTTAASGYSAGDDGATGKTRCEISVPGPSA